MVNPKKGRWYIKLGDSIQGPFPNKLIGRYLILGRITQDMLVSQDKKSWAPIKSYPAMVPEVVKEAGTAQGDRALMLARIREDERSANTEGNGEDGAADERRDEEEQIMQLHRQMRDDVLNHYNTKPGKKTVYYSIAGVLLLTLTGFFLSTQNSEDIAQAQCSSEAHAGINWSGCNKQGEVLRNYDLKGVNFRSAMLQTADLSAADMQKADLAYANLSQSILLYAQLQQSNMKGANLRQANLQGANLTAANLSYAELAGAQLQGAILKQAIFDHAIWVNGETCLPGSVGACLLAVESP
ncbi:hypothetical protein MNBD_GAMMA09-2748 [hydrothermal vent metagenome]|uniref:Pentapeptide repeat family protein n=1 Tax=hydrothermal vent metagenome TaxID=652676 RepID=A0A3B0YGE5_9ZZZZ